MTELYRFAERRIRITSLHRAVHTLCAAYRAPGGEEDFAVRTGQIDIDLEREQSAREDRREGVPVRHYSDEYLESLAVYRKIAERMPACDTILLHGSAIAADGAGYLFTARSGTGKSTHARLWRELLGDRAVTINDDKPILRAADGGVLVCGTPWDGKHRLSCNRSVPLRGIALLERAAENRIEPISPRAAYPMLLQQVYRPRDSAALQQTLTLLDRLAAAVPLWRLGCNMSPEAARVSYEAMKGEQP
ncbi:MAG: hypothetical protein IKD79_01715 [Oscillospiraceae bacterium]|nr:hypothetical protein [Oscillospiraceae bacterium]